MFVYRGHVPRFTSASLRSHCMLHIYPTSVGAKHSADVHQLIAVLPPATSISSLPAANEAYEKRCILLAPLAPESDSGRNHGDNNGYRQPKAVSIQKRDSGAIGGTKKK